MSIETAPAPLDGVSEEKPRAFPATGKALRLILVLALLFATLALLQRTVLAARPVLVDAAQVSRGVVAQTVSNNGVPVDLTAKEYALLRWFMLHPDEVHSAERLLEHVWDENVDPFTNTVRTTIYNLRRKLAAAGGGSQPIETLPGRGYRLGERP